MKKMTRSNEKCDTFEFFITPCLHLLVLREHVQHEVGLGIHGARLDPSHEGLKQLHIPLLHEGLPRLKIPLAIDAVQRSNDHSCIRRLRVQDDDGVGILTITKK